MNTKRRIIQQIPEEYFNVIEQLKVRLKKKNLWKVVEHYLSTHPDFLNDKKVLEALDGFSFKKEEHEKEKGRIGEVSTSESL